MKKILCLFFAFIVLLTTCSYGAEANVPYICDEAGVLSDSSEKELESLALNVSQKHNIDVAVLTVNSLGGQSEVYFADDYYDEHYGKDGVLLLYSVQDEIRYVSTCGICIDAVDENLSDISEAISEHFYRNDYDKGFASYINTVDKLVSSHKAKSLTISILVSLVIGFAAAFIVTGRMKSQLDGAKLKAQARDYLKKDSFNITRSNDLFLYRSINRTPKPKNNSSTHTSSSGRTHGGGRV